METNPKIGVLCSAGGSAFFAAYDMCKDAELISSENIFLITDRACGAEALADERAVMRARIVDDDAGRFSAAAACRYVEAGCGLVLMLFNRLVSADLFARLTTLNIHPALLPSFKGMSAVRRARESGARDLGATLHVADETVDGGPILAQVSSPIDPSADLVLWNRVSFIQKTYLCAVLIEAICSAWRVNRPPLSATLTTPNLRRAFATFQERLQMQVVAL